MDKLHKLTVMLYGAGGHAAVVESAIMAGDDYYIFEVVDDAKPAGTKVLHSAVFGGRDVLKQFYEDGLRHIHVAIGDNVTREKVSRELEELGFTVVTVTHPRAVVEAETTIGTGSFLAAQSVVGARSVVGRGCIINTSASVDHDCALGAFVHICPGAHLAGTVRVGDRAMVGTGAAVVPGISIGADAVVGAGAVVIRAVPPNVTVAGNPARQLAKKQEG